MKSFNRKSDFKLYITVIVVTFVLALAFVFLSPWASLAVVVSAAAASIVFIKNIEHRNDMIAKLSGTLDLILNNGEIQDLKEYEEGELAILKNEVFKLCQRLSEQTEVLKEDKLYLADSIADISHQIKTPLTSINIIMSFLSDESLTFEKRIEYVNEIKKLLSRMEWLVTSLLKISKLDAGTIQFRADDVKVKELVLKSVSPIEISMDINNQHFVLDCDDDISFTGDFEWSCESLSNILKNCTEHTPDGGTITVTAKENAVLTELTVNDTGTGFSEKDLPHIFERFYKGENSSEKSVGIGLNLSRAIILKQNGTIKAENNRDGGACFTIKFYKSIV